MRSPSNNVRHELSHFYQWKLSFDAKKITQKISANNIVGKTRALAILVLVAHIGL